MAHTDGAVDVITRMARLLSTAYPPADVASGLGVNQLHLQQRRLTRTLWAIDRDGAWVYPRVQFEAVDGTHGRHALQQVRGLDQVLPALPPGVHPLAVAGFLLTPQLELSLDGRPRTVREWLRGGGPVEPVLRLIEIEEWAAQ